jgi:hypothetical protein
VQSARNGVKGTQGVRLIPFPYAGMTQIRFQGVISVPGFLAGTPLTAYHYSTIYGLGEFVVN